jgi:carbon-monoxide dehydrogenase large subunit
MSVLGTRVVRVEDPKFLTTGGVYTADLTEHDDPRLAGAVSVSFVRSMLAHGTVAGIDIDDARDAAGVLGVHVAADLAAHGLGPAGGGTNPLARPWLAADRVRFVGEPLAVVVTERADQGEDAAEAVFADIEPLTAVIGPEAAATDEVLLFPDTGTNTVGAFNFGEEPTLFDGCEVVVRQRIVNQRVAACPLETRSAAAVWEGDQLTMWVSTQSAHSARQSLMAAFGLEDHQVRVIAPDVGGGFGAKISLGPEEVLVAWAAKAHGRPARWHETRSESMVGMGHGRAQVNVAEIGGRRDGTIEAYKLTVLQDAGAYPGVGASLPFMTRAMAPGVYDIERVESTTATVVTNTTVIDAYRGAGRPEATHAIERMIDLFAAEIGMDPIEVRRRNFIAPDKFPFTTKMGSVYDNGEYARSLDLAVAAAGLDELREEQAARRASGDPVQLGIGVAVYVEVTAGPFPGEQEYARVEVADDGSVTIYTGSSSHGQGHDTSWAMLANDQLGVPMDRVRVVHGDTDLVPEGTGTWGSRSLQVGGTAVVHAAEQLVERARFIAAELLEAAPEDVVLDTTSGQFHVAGTPAVTKSWSDVAGAARSMKGEAPPAPGAPALSETSMFSSSTPTFPFGTHIAVVEVDTETGRSQLRRIITCDDAGQILNPLVVEGQRHGGIAQGVAQTLLEEICYDADGNPITANLADYALISATEVPAYELVLMETPTFANPLGAKGIGESGAIGSTPAVHNAVLDAIGHLGVRHIDLPTTAERVWRAISEARDPSALGPAATEGRAD